MAKEGGDDIHWIESESLFATIGSSPTIDQKHQKQNEALHNHATETINTTGDDDGCVDLCLDNLFVDPDPYESFTLRWNILYDSSEALNINDDNQRQISNSNHHDIKTYSIIPAQITVIGDKAENGQTLHSTGLTLWNATYLLCNYLVQQHNIHQRRKATIASSTTTKAVLELGCGLGIPSMLNHYYMSSSPFHRSKNGCSTITFATDADVKILSNLRSNNLQRVQQEQEGLFSKYKQKVESNSNNVLTCQQLIWGNTSHIQHILQMVHEYRILYHKSDHKLLHENEVQNGFDLIIGADIIYVKHVVPVLFDTVQQLLGRRRYKAEEITTEKLNADDDDDVNAKFVLAFTHRNVSIDYVLHIAEEKGFDYEYVPSHMIPISSLQSFTHEDDDESKNIFIEGTTKNIDAADMQTTTHKGSSMEGIYIFRRKSSP